MTPLSFDDLMFLPHHACRFVSGEGEKKDKVPSWASNETTGFCVSFMYIVQRNPGSFLCLDMSWTCYQLFKRQAALIRGMTIPRYAITCEFGTQVTPARGC